MYLDWTYIILVLPAVIFAMWASGRVNTVFQKYSSQYSRSGMTGYDAARRVLDANGLNDVKIENISGKLTDHYDPKANVIRLSEDVYSSSSCAAIGVAAHEAGHAIQHATGYLPIKIRSAIIPITNIGSRLALPLVLLGLIFSSYGSLFINIAYAGVACFSLCALFQLVTLPTEYNASRRAVAAIEECNVLSADEADGAKKVLSAAALTYVAALAVTLMQLLRLFMMVGRRDRRN